VSLVAEQMLLEHGHACHDAGIAACGEGVELDVGGNQGCGEFSVCCSTGAGTPYLGRDVVEFFAVL
jgi:hypothetical protein